MDTSCGKGRMESSSVCGWTRRLVGMILLGGLAGSGCGPYARRVEPVVVPNRLTGPITIAVAPALNQSGSVDFDRNRFADLMASELSYAEGVKVVPVNRVLALLGAQELESVESPEHAMELVRLLGVDGLLVFAVTDYDPYEPPILGITCQLYGTRVGATLGGMDPVTLSRQPTDGVSVSPAATPGLLGETQRFFDASHESVIDGIQRFAKKRGANGSPYGWRLYVVSQQHFIRYCCHSAIRSLFGGDGEPAMTRRAPRRMGRPS